MSMVWQQGERAAAVRCLGWLCAVALALGTAGCGSHVLNRNAVGAVAAVGHLPTSQLSQIYYLGVFDPAEQTPPTFYRIRVQAQASALNDTKYASGWVPAALIDSLSGRGMELLEGQPPAPGASSPSAVGFLQGRKHVVFGPEGYREVPKNQRLVIVMGSDPSAFFSGIDQALGVVAEATQGRQGPVDLLRRLAAEQNQLIEQDRQLEALAKSPLKAEGNR